MNLVQADGSVSPAFAWSSPIGSPAEVRCLLISIHPLGVVDVNRPTSLVFIGGFDSSAVMNDPTVPASLLALSYPAENVDELRDRIGTIDFSEPGAA